MPEFSELSIKNIKTLEPRLQRLCYEVIQYYDFSVLCGFRNKKDQNEVYELKRSNRKWPNSMHNILPSNAVDIAPYPINWKDKKEFFFLGGLMMAEAWRLNIPLRWGGRWKELKDLGHYELMT